MFSHQNLSLRAIKRKLQKANLETKGNREEEESQQEGRAILQKSVDWAWYLDRDGDGQ